MAAHWLRQLLTWLGLATPPRARLPRLFFDVADKPCWVLRVHHLPIHGGVTYHFPSASPAALADYVRQCMASHYVRLPRSSTEHFVFVEDAPSQWRFVAAVVVTPEGEQWARFPCLDTRFAPATAFIHWAHPCEGDTGTMVALPMADRYVLAVVRQNRAECFISTPYPSPA